MPNAPSGIAPVGSSLGLSSCDREPIHAIGAIQAHGQFLAFRLSDKTVYHASQNLTAILGRDLKEIIGASLEDLFPPAVASRLLEAAKLVAENGAETTRLRDFPEAGSIFEAYLYDFEGLIAVEFEERVASRESEVSAFANARRRSRSFIEDLHSSTDLISASKLVCRAVRSMIGFDRVMMYRYLPNWDGEVIAEDKASEAHSFLHHRFPASDIPLPARTLYLKNRTRQIFDSASDTSPIEPPKHYLTRKPIDLSNSKLRAVSRIHLEYLKNMQVRSSFSIAVIVDRQLWGLIACHGIEPVSIPHEIRSACESLASTFAVLAKIVEELTSKSAHLAFEAKMRGLFQDLRLSEKPLNLLLRKHNQVEEMFAATGIALANNSAVEIAGLAPPQEYTAELAHWLRERFKRENKTVLAVECLSVLEPRWKPLKDLSCGVLAVYSADLEESVFLIFRPEVLRTIVWGGDPRKTLEKRDYQGEINPRVSFESWSETLREHSAKWLPYEVQGVVGLRDFVFDSLAKKDLLIQALAAQLSLNKV